MQEEQKLKSKNILYKLLLYNKEQTGWLILACMFSAAFGAINPMVAIPVAEFIDLFPRFYEQDKQNWRDDVNYWCLVLLLIAIALFLFFSLQMFFFYIVGENLILKIRGDCFRKLNRWPAASFDIPKNNPGTLAARLGSDVLLVS